MQGKHGNEDSYDKVSYDKVSCDIRKGSDRSLYRNPPASLLCADYFLIFAVFARPAFVRVFLYAFNLEAGTRNTAFLLIPLKAFFPIFLSTLLLITTLFSFLQL